MSAQGARVIDLEQYRRRREEQRERQVPVIPPMMWVPVWVWVPVWPVV